MRSHLSLLCWTRILHRFSSVPSKPSFLLQHTRYHLTRLQNHAGCTIWAVELLRRQITRLLETDSRSNGIVPFDLPDKMAGPRASDESTQTEERATATDASCLRINAILIDYFLYDTCKEQERMATRVGEEADGDSELPSPEKDQAGLDGGERSMLMMIPHHRVKSIWY